jgi:uncharacterized protein YacL
MTMLVARLLLIAACAGAGALVAPILGRPPLDGVALGGLIAGVAVALEIGAGRVPLRPLLGVVAGSAAGLLLGVVIGAALAPLVGVATPILQAGAGLVGAWVGGALAGRRVAELPAPSRPAAEAAPRILDTSVIVDGRIADVADAGFLDGDVIVPQFVVRELQRLADAGDTLRRGRGRRGFDVLDRLRRSAGVRLELVDTDFVGIAEVDAKLIALARARGARLLTTDTALVRVASLAGVPTGNLNDLAAALRPAAVPGERLRVQVLREGKEAGQGVAFLPDGTMVVVEGGKRFIGQALDAVVTSVLQTSGGRMIFARLQEDDGARDA